MATRFLDRSIHTLGCYLALFTTEAGFHRELKRLNVRRGDWPPFSRWPHMATTHYLEKPSGEQMALVTVADMEDRSGITVASYLAHEAVHVWQFHLEIIGDKSNHSKEFEAYGVQNIFTSLAEEYARQKGLT